jgi:hypothetical protein
MWHLPTNQTTTLSAMSYALLPYLPVATIVINMLSVIHAYASFHIFFAKVALFIDICNYYRKVIKK